MAYDLEEQEQIDQLKAFWNKYGNMLIWVLTIALAAYAAWNGWNYFQRNKSQEASKLYEEVQKMAEAKDAPKILRVAADMQTKYGNTSYAQMTALMAAKTAFDANDVKGAKAQLQWLVEGKKDPEFQAIGKLRLSGLLLDEKAYDAALKLLDSSFPAQFAAPIADRRGDILVAQNKLADARAAYQLALDKLDKESQGRQLIQIKLDAIGGGKPAEVAAK
jgi:predicted negative regulator of RcsB-dependent stress response